MATSDAVRRGAEPAFSFGGSDSNASVVSSGNRSSSRRPGDEGSDVGRPGSAAARVHGPQRESPRGAYAAFAEGESMQGGSVQEQNQATPRTAGQLEGGGWGGMEEAADVAEETIRAWLTQDGVDPGQGQAQGQQQWVSSQQGAGAGEGGKDKGKGRAEWAVGHPAVRSLAAAGSKNSSWGSTRSSGVAHGLGNATSDSDGADSAAIAADVAMLNADVAWGKGDGVAREALRGEEGRDEREASTSSVGIRGGSGGSSRKSIKQMGPRSGSWANVMSFIGLNNSSGSTGMDSPGGSRRGSREGVKGAASNSGVASTSSNMDAPNKANNAIAPVPGGVVSPSGGIPSTHSGSLPPLPQPPTPKAHDAASAAAASEEAARKLPPSFTAHLLGVQYSNVKSSYALAKQELGAGRFGVIRTCLKRSTGQLLACKTISKRKMLVRTFKAP